MVTFLGSEVWWENSRLKHGGSSSLMLIASPNPIDQAITIVRERKDNPVESGMISAIVLPVPLNLCFGNCLTTACIRFSPFSNKRQVRIRSARTFRIQMYPLSLILCLAQVHRLNA